MMIDGKMTDGRATSRQLADSAQNIRELRKIVEAFDGCILKQNATNTVFADGSIKAKIMLIGEAPGVNEDIHGIPFCGQSGKLLDKMLLSVGLDRSNVYITNTVFWRPPNNRRPTAEEIALCRPFVEKHIALLNPLIVVLVGSTAVESIMKQDHEKFSMHTLRGRYWRYENCYTTARSDVEIQMTTIFHPSYLLRNPIKKKDAWFDLIRIREKLHMTHYG